MTATPAAGTAVPTPDDIRALVEAGASCHWLHLRSKAPVGEGWSEAPFRTMDELRSTYRQGYNTGVRLGEPSDLVGGGFLYALDLDIRDADQAEDAWDALRALLPDVHLDQLPSVVSGSGGASRHLYFTTDRPFFSRKLAISGEKYRESDGRWRNTWEIELMGTGRQIVLPPSIHPDTGKPYVWERPLTLGSEAFGLSIAPEIVSDLVAELTEAVDAEYPFETVKPLTFKRGQLEAELRELPIARLDDYHHWIALGQALHHQFGGSLAGYDLWLEHSKRSEKFDRNAQRSLRSRWRGFGRNRRRPITMATIRQWALEARRERILAEFD